MSQEDNSLASYLGLSSDELNSVEYEITDNTGNDDALYGYIITFNENTPSEFLEKVGADSQREISVPPHAIDGEDDEPIEDEGDNEQGDEI